MNLTFEKLKKNLTAEIEYFRQSHINLLPDQADKVYKDWYRIGFYEEYYSLLTSNDDILDKFKDSLML